ncbi:flavin-dependent oxidoreductase [Mesorhizobium sp. CAU 1741]|uniref:flavin-dependent oxidoreductase n=1 Tax=Mesorhizobium sp. CAU 1741 TaxID=3140366 RepID=UPI00325BCAEE
MEVIIAGAGIAGLSLALSLHQAGIAARVYEQVPAIRPLGVGINVQPHAVRELFELGLADRLEEIGVRTREVAYFSKKGGLIWSEPRGMYAGYNWPQFSVHRGKLQMILYEAVRERLGASAVTGGTSVTGFHQDGKTVTVRLRGPDGIERSDEADFLIAADGIHSAVRKQLFPNEGPPRWGGAVLWRGTTVAKPYLTGATMAMAGHEWQKFVTYPISKTDPETGEALINWIGELKYEPGSGWNREDWNRKGDFADFMPAFEDWRFDWLDCPALMRAGGECFEYPMVDRDPLERWTSGRVTLLGDAGHPMYPIGSNGASQAIMDARVLTRAFIDHGMTTEALEAYEAERRPATTRIVEANRGNGPDQVMQVVEERCGGVFDDIAQVLSREELEQTAAGYKKIAGFDVDTLNSRPSIVPGKQSIPA